MTDSAPSPPAPLPRSGGGGSEAASKGRRWRVNPFADLLHLPHVDIGQGTARMELPVEEIHLRPGGILHGGMLATLMDTITGFAAYSVVPEGADVLTMQLNLNMTATAKLGDTVVATSKVVHAGRKTAVVTGELRLPDGKLLATGSATMFIVEGGLPA